MQFASPFAAPPPTPLPAARGEEDGTIPDPWPPPRTDAITVELPSPFQSPPPVIESTDPWPLTSGSKPSEEGGAIALPPTPSPAPSPAPLGFGEVDLVDSPAPVLGHADEPFPFEMPEARSAPAEAAPAEDAAIDAGEPALHGTVPPPPPDPFRSPPGVPEAQGQGGDAEDPFRAILPEVIPGAGREETEAPSAAFSEAAPAEPPVETGMAVEGAPEERAPELGSLGGLGSLGAKETEELEMLFDDGAAKKGRAPSGPTAPAAPPPAAGLFRVRRRSGKVFGPFTEAEVVQMLGKGELLGNEDVSADDGATFGPIREVPSFGEAMRRLTEAPGPASAPAPRSPGLARKAPEGKAAPPAVRSAAVARLREAARKLAGAPWLKLALAGGALAIVLAVGLGAGLTPYGVFFYRLVLGQTGSHRPGAKLLAEARGRLAEDGYAGVKAALDLSDRALRIQPSDREAKALYAHAASLLVRRHGGGGEAWARAKGFLPELRERIGDDPDAARAVLSASLVPGERTAADAAAALQRHVSKDPRDGDALLVLGDAALARSDLGQAAALYARLDALRPGTARAAHALGVLAARRGDAAAARKSFEAALASDPRHLASAVELARLALGAGDLAAAEQHARRVLAQEAQGQAGPAERAHAHTVLGQVLSRAPGEGLEARLAQAEKELEAATREDPEDLEARLALASFELDRKAPEKAAAALAPALSAAAREPRLVVLQARALAGQGRVLDALTLLDGALEKAPGDARLLFVKGLVLAQGGKRAEGEKLWTESLARAPEAWEPHLALGRARLARGELAEAEKELKLAAEKAPAEGGVLSGMADLLLARKDLAGAEQGYGRALATDPAHAEAHLGLARVALARGDDATARAALERAIVLEPRLEAAQVAYGELLWRAHDLAGAKKALQAAVAIDPRDGVARGRLGAVELEAGEVDAALPDLLTASNLEMGSAEVRGWYARALVAKGELVQALEQLHKAVELDPRSAQLQLQLGQALERAGSLPEAVEAYRAAQALAPGLVEPYEAQAALYAGQNRCGEALPLLDKAMALAPGEQRLRVASADCRMRLGRFAEAAAIYRHALQANPKLVALCYKIARAEHEARGRAGALPWYERAAREEPGNPMPHYYLGFAYKERGQRQRAIDSFRAYLRARPDAEDRKDIEQEIEDLGGTP